LAGTAIVLKPDTDSEAIQEGFGLYLRRFPALIKYHHIRVEVDGSFNPEQFQQAAKQAVMIRVKLS
jgi:pentose-5-phosphate-3-epimerase